jgi:hypothetical protein
MSSVITTFEPGPGNTIRFFTHFEASGAEAAGHGQEDVAPQAEIFGIPWAEFIAAGFGIVDRPENGPATIRRFDNQPEDTETGQ